MKTTTTSTSKAIISKVRKTTSQNQAPVVDFQNNKIGKVVLNLLLWKTEVNNQVVHDVVVSQHTSWRLSTKKVKSRGEVSGGGKKPWRQKGTGRARHGSIRSPIWVGGGVTFGPTGNENYTKKVNRKVFRKAVCMILSNCLENDKLIFWNDVDLKKPSSKMLIGILKKLSLNDQKVLLILDQKQLNLILSARNLQKVKAVFGCDVNPYDLINADKILVFDKLVVDLEKRLGF